MWITFTTIISCGTLTICAWSIRKVGGNLTSICVNHARICGILAIVCDHHAKSTSNLAEVSEGLEEICRIVAARHGANGKETT